MIIDIGDLEIEKEIGAGAYGRVFKGKWRSGDVAIKVLHSNLDDKSAEEFLMEASIHKNLRPHVAVVQFLGICIHNKNYMIVTEFCHGGSLESYLLNIDNKITTQQSLRFLQGIAAGMLHLSFEGIIHRDLAARNCLLTSNLDVKVSDFGMSRIAISQQHTSKTEVGPLKYMAPESIADNVYSEKTDVWSFGVVVYEVISRKEPYDDLQPVQVATKINTRSVILPDVDIYPELSQLMRSCMQWIPDQRPTFKDICNTLSKISY